ncbi:hypothetical protein BDF14DRAFT_1800000 [Spinellus fusiger]|nr:hypothetical protein BDF14DRAFT_1800000 [Spinellus fusiger]
MKARTSILKTLVDSGLSTTPPPPPPLTTTNTTTTHTTTTTTTTTTTPTTLNPLRRITKDESVFLVKYAQRNSHEAYEKSRKSSIERSMMITPTDSSSSSSNSSFGHGYTWKASSSEKMPTGRASPPFPAPSRSSLLKDLKSFTKRRNGSSPPLKDPVVPVKTVTTKKEKAPSPLHSKSTIINTSDRKEIKSSGLNKLSRRVKSQSIPPKSLQQVQPNINSTPRTSLPAKTVQAKTQHGRKGVVELISSKKLLPSGPNISATILHLHAKK